MPMKRTESPGLTSPARPGWNSPMHPCFRSPTRSSRIFVLLSEFLTWEPLAKFSGIVAILDRQQHFEPPMVLCNTKQLGQSHCDHVRGEDSGIPTRRDQAVTGSFGALAFLGDESHLSDESQDL